MKMNPGDHVDWRRKASHARWHGVVRKVDDTRVEVLWLLSDSEHDTTQRKKERHPYHVGYVTIELKDDLIPCAKGLSLDGNDYHPSKNPWGKKFGIAIEN